MTWRRPWILAGALVTVAATAVTAVVTGEGRELLPDLRPARPYGLAVSTVVESTGGRRFQLGFGAAIENVGDGPLVLDGLRAAGEPTMSVTQVVTLSRGGSTHRPVAGSGLTYERGPDHAHWHYQAAIVYRLYHADGRLARAGTKTGFCLGDRYRLSGAQPGAPARPRFTGFCARGEPELISLRQGISTGYGDDYPGFLEGQSLDLTGLPAGVYRLVHETNPDRLLAETDHANNTAAVTFTLTWPRGPEQAPVITMAGAKRCEIEGTLLSRRPSPVSGGDAPPA